MPLLGYAKTPLRGDDNTAATYYSESKMKHTLGEIRVSCLLVVEHHNATRRSLKIYLSAALPNADVHDAGSALQALEMVPSEVPDIVIMDFALPYVSGAEATRAIKRLWPEVHVIMLIMDKSQSAPALEAGADACVFKGGPSSELLDAVLSLGPNG
jgi:DNA-binding NarL/FixJ family response regulator